jgi:5-formyltetrahydrofolate cyclo-ligase
MTEKTIAREHGKTMRAKIGTQARQTLDALIIERCVEKLDWDNYRQIHLFLPIPARHEINTWPLLNWIWKTHPLKQVFVPRMIGGDIESVAIDETTEFGPNAFGVPEPMRGRTLEPAEKLNLVIAPLLAFDEQGHRVGYGGGYYDRFLATQPEAEKVGLAYEDCLINSEIESSSYDVGLDLVVTDKLLHLFR